MDQRYTGKSAIVTGAGSGIGRAVAERIAAEGGRVACVDLVADNVEATAAAIGGDAIALTCDVSDYAQVEAAVTAANDAFGQVDVLFNVAGIGGFDHSHEIDPARFEKIVAVNLTGSFNMCRAVLPQMVERGVGAIVNTASTAGVMGQPWSAAYSRVEGWGHPAHQSAGHRVRPAAVHQRGSTGRRRDAALRPVHPAGLGRLEPTEEDVARQRGAGASGEAGQCLRLPRLRGGELHDRLDRRRRRRHLLLIGC